MLWKPVPSVVKLLGPQLNFPHSSGIEGSKHHQLQARAQASAEQLRAEYPLHELRRAGGLSQGEIAKTLQVSQANVSKIEKRTDIYISTLRSHIHARFPDGDVVMTGFSDI